MALPRGGEAEGVGGRWAAAIAGYQTASDRYRVTEMPFSQWLPYEL